MSREDAAERAAAVHALVVGVVFIRRVLRSTTLATMDDAELERPLGRSIQALVTANDGGLNQWTSST
jgi:hypothetical protein